MKDACRIISPDCKQRPKRTWLAGSSINAKLSGIIPSPLSIEPDSGKYDDAATTFSISVVNHFPSTAVPPTQVTMTPKSSTNAFDEHEGDSIT